MDKKILKQLVSLNSVSSQSNLEVIKFLSNYLESFDYQTKLTKIKSKANLFAFRPTRGKRIILAAHSDTVPPGDGWKTNPNHLIVKNNQYFGLGVCDMKGFISVVLDIMKKYEGDNLASLLTFNEETDLAGANLVKPDWVKPNDVIIIGEPTKSQLIFETKGAVVFEVKFQGIGGHGSEPSRGLSAISEAARFINLVESGFNDFSAKYLDGDFSQPKMTLNYGSISGGEAINKIAENAWLVFEVRFSRPRQIKYLELYFKSCLKKIDAKSDMTITNQIPAFKCKTSLKNKLVKAGVPHKYGVSYATEASIYQNLTSNIVIYGPGSIKNAHQPNESIGILEIEKYQKLLKKLINHF